jgi:hypothetical protein
MGGSVRSRAITPAGRLAAATHRPGVENGADAARALGLDPCRLSGTHRVGVDQHPHPDPRQREAEHPT